MVPPLVSRAYFKLRQKAGRDRPPMSLQAMQVAPEAARAALADEPSDLAAIFLGNEDRLIHKWLHYFPIYERYLSAYRETGVRMMEIGVFRGGSLGMWRRYFGPQAVLTGVDINPDCAAYVDPPNRVAIGSQDDPAFLRRTVAEMGGLDIVLDDGSHIARHQRASFDILFPLLAEGGLYIIEDVHTAYWTGEFEGGYGRPGTAVELGKGLVDDLHHWYHQCGLTSAHGEHVGAVHFHDSIVVIEKRRSAAPRHSMIGFDPADHARSPAKAS